MRKLLDTVYRASGVSAAACLLAICSIVLLQVGANLVDAVAGWITGAPIGLVVPSYAEFAGFFLAASSFLALAYSLRAGSLIRVTLVVRHFTGRWRRGVDLWCTAASAVLAGYFSVYTVGLVVESIAFGDVSPGMVPVPLWIPQSAMALGLIVFTIALIDGFIEVLRGAEPSYLAGDEGGAADGPGGAAPAGS